MSLFVCVTDTDFAAAATGKSFAMRQRRAVGTAGRQMQQLQKSTTSSGGKKKSVESNGTGKANGHV